MTSAIVIENGNKFEKKKKTKGKKIVLFLAEQIFNTLDRNSLIRIYIVTASQDE